MMCVSVVCEWMLLCFRAGESVRRLFSTQIPWAKIQQTSALSIHSESDWKYMFSSKLNATPPTAIGDRQYPLPPLPPHPSMSCCCERYAFPWLVICCTPPFSENNKNKPDTLQSWMPRLWTAPTNSRAEGGMRVLEVRSSLFEGLARNAQGRSRTSLPPGLLDQVWYFGFRRERLFTYTTEGLCGNAHKTKSSAFCWPLRKLAPRHCNNTACYCRLWRDFPWIVRCEPGYY